MPALILFLILFGVPVAEIALFIQIGDAIGLWATLGFIVLTAAVGALLVRAQGLRVLAQIQAEAEAGTAPVGALISGACLLVAGLLLLTPGFLTDAIGFALLLPPVQAALGRSLVGGIAARSAAFRFRTAGTSTRRGPAGRAGAGGFRRDRRGVVIDGEFQEIDPETAEPDQDASSPADVIEPPRDKKDPHL
ncbi:MAG: FxsA family protein [Alphaproteobacteria bacterium]|nr:FxsA family protein [Alphaproteobacteria bacterium]